MSVRRYKPLSKPAPRGALKTRMLKAQCGSCAYSVRVSRTWLCEAGPPICPCNRDVMECPQWDEIMELEQEAAAQSDRLGTVVRVKRVRLRIDRDCNGCGGRMAAGQTSKRTVYTLGGQLSEEDLCSSCADPNAERGYSGGTNGDERWRTELHRG